VVRFVAWDGVHVGACVWRAVCSFFRPGGSRGGAVCPVCTLRVVFGVQFVIFVGVAVAGVVWFVPRDGVHVAACVWRAAGTVCRRRGGRGVSVCPAGRCATWGLSLACTWCRLSASRWRTWRWAWWRVLCGLSRGTVCKLPLVFVVQLVLFVVVAAADVALDVVVVTAVRFVPRDGLRGPTRLASGASWRRSEWGPLAGLGM